ncbi:hypothetical protein [Pseudonocardia pini]|uniref:hypothetical protein n=1 Tax=Pseudonocardia pini TaxID=2758030 RepID=UPI0015F077C6|nr:hypothetical protein [Pseudonocardia pini]
MDEGQPIGVEGHVELSVRGIRDSWNPAEALWDRQLRTGTWGPTLGTEAITSTLICLIGVDRWDPSAWQTIGASPAAALRAARERLAATPYPGGLGLLVWANALHGEADLEQLLRETGLELGDRRTFSTTITSMEASWLLSGLLHEYSRRPAESTREFADAVMTDVHARFDEAGSDVMPHATKRAALGHRARRHVANFADQIYALQALSFASTTIDSAGSYDRARRLATRLMELQGPLGQWWWQYDSRTGETADRYPVYSVHQHAMAPMALLAYAAAVRERGEDPEVAAAVERSATWVDRNELGRSMVDPDRTIWRSVEIESGRFGRTARHAKVLAGRGDGEGGDRLPALVLNRETRPYEWAWHLYAQAILTGRERSLHLI